MAHPAVYDQIPASQQQVINTALLDQITVRSGTTTQPFRIDGFRGLRDNYGSMAEVMDIRGISPLFLASAQRIIYQDYISNPIAWELFAVRYVFSERETLSALPTALLTQGSDRDGNVYLHELTDPRPFAHLVYHADLVDSDDFAYELLTDPRYDLRNSIILQQDPGVILPENPPSDHSVRVTAFHPERIDLEAQTTEPAILSLAMVNYPGWKAFINNQQVPIIRAYSTLSAIAIPAGEHQITIQYDPNSYRIGAVLSLLTWGGICILGIHWLFSRIRLSPTQE
jgi:hypothetical protein